MVGDGRWWFGLDFLECLPPSLGKMISKFDDYIFLKRCLEFFCLKSGSNPHCTYGIYHIRVDCIQLTALGSFQKPIG